MLVKVYSKPGCMPCKLTKMKLDKVGVSFVELSAEEHVDHLRKMAFSELPVVEVDCGDGAFARWSGYSPDKIAQLGACK